MSVPFYTWCEQWPALVDGDQLETRFNYLKGCNRRHLTRISSVRMDQVIEGRMQLVERVAYPLLGELEPIVEVTYAPTAHELLKLAERKLADPGEIARRTVTEAVIVFDLAFKIDEINTHDPQHRVKQDITRLTDLLRREFFDGSSKTMSVWSYHDPADAYAVRDVQFETRLQVGKAALPSQEFERHNPLPFRRTKSGKLFTFHPRAKDLFTTACKEWKQVTHDAGKREQPTQVLDRRGVKFVAMNREDAQELLAEFTAVMVAAGAVVTPDGNNLFTDDPVDKGNGSSSRNFKAAKLLIHWQDAYYEVQFMALADHLSSMYALDDRNHTLYRIRQACDFYFPWLFPPNVYTTIGSWKSPAVRRPITISAIERLGWNLDPRKL